MDQLLEELRAGLWAVWNRRWLALGVAWATCLAGWLLLALVPNTYESETRIFVQLDDVLAEQIGIGAGSRARDIDRIRQTLASSVNLEKVVRTTRIGDSVTSPTQMESAIARLSDDIEVVSQGQNIFEITATSSRTDLSDNENAELAQVIAQRMIDIFREENLGGARGEMADSIEFLNQQLEAREAELAAAEERRLAFEAANPELIGGAQAIAAQLAATRSELRSVEADLAASQSALAALDGQISSTPRTIVTPGAGSPQASLAQAQANLAALEARGLTAEHPDIIAARRTVANLREQAQAAGAPAGQINPAYSSLQSMRVERLSNVQALQSRKAALSAEIAGITASQAREPGAAAEAQRISRDYDVLREQYDQLLQDREELRLRGQVETERSAVQFEVIDPPTTPRSPVAPNRPLLLLAVLVLGLGAGAGSAYALSKLGSTFATAGQLERAFGLPVIGTISHTFTEAGRELRAKRLKYFAAGVGGLGVLFAVLMCAEFVQRGMVA
ncbi:XrtA system polysaccharide chain length determinant [Aurantiacibacter poecillastricola]|uniref:XrtA system polysaccharide chain length determinant n=1 Tax=Aurantiacibacter poecillastricola TaxID=3064385 RepID=UPI00273EF5BE|nr:XrtA system polysaccharide chain length determinant [Aurantiacibacter sp. 219JJ12-13]MDP5262164.1 GNVR domain-containing protein [Aurantiacibacter sp. 219JJ12-13]